ncbi:MAG TPA: J domain-containing protein [Desulfuromonadales bacterium]|nr:J domain-containing protein [Desulfuromonadales bacterium]
MTFDELQNAWQVFQLTERASLKEIKERHRVLIKRYHPDSGGGDPERIRQVNEAYRVLQTYVSNYRFCFNRDEFYEQNPEERIRDQFPLWGSR